MISFKLTDEQEVVREAMHDFAEQAVRPLARDADEESKLPEEFLAQSWELGFVGTQLPEAFGGGGEARSAVTNAIVLDMALVRRFLADHVTRVRHAVDLLDRPETPEESPGRCEWPVVTRCGGSSARAAWARCIWRRTRCGEKR